MEGFEVCENSICIGPLGEGVEITRNGDYLEIAMYADGGLEFMRENVPIEVMRAFLDDAKPKEVTE